MEAIPDIVKGDVMTLRAIKALDYDGRRFAAGQVFEPRSASDAEILTLAQLAEEVGDGSGPPPSKKKYKTRQLKAEDE